MRADRFWSVYYSVYYKDISACLLFLLFIWKLYGNVAHLWWTYDDTQILKHAILYSPYQYFLNPLIWQEYSANFLTPLLIFSFDIDKALFGLNPKWFYVHQLGIIWLCSVMFYIVLKRWIQRPFAFIGSLLFLIGAPIAVLSQQLMTRHYLEGLLMALVAIHLFVKGLDKGDMKWSYFSAFAYAISMAAKEVYVPLVFVLLVLPCSTWKNRFTHALPHIVMLLLYSAWRWYMLGTPIGGYGHAINIKSALILPYGIIDFLFDLKSIPGIFISVIFGIFLIVFWLHQKRSVLLGVWIGLLVLIPIIPVSHMLPMVVPRVFLLVWVALAVFLVLIVRFTWNVTFIGKILCIGLLLLIGFQGVSLSTKAWSDNFIMAKRISTEGKFVFERANVNNLLRHPASEGYYFEGINWLKHHYYHDKRNSEWFYDDIYLCENNLDRKRVFEYSLHEQKIKDIIDSISFIRSDYCGKVRNDVPLFVRGNYSKNIISWELGPYSDGRYSFILGGTHTKRDMLPKGSLRAYFKDYIAFRIRYESPDGWITFSPYLIVKIHDGIATLHWERGQGGKETSQ
jgi:hypothetical protein